MSDTSLMEIMGSIVFGVYRQEHLSLWTCFHQDDCEFSLILHLKLIIKKLQRRKQLLSLPKCSFGGGLVTVSPHLHMNVILFFPSVSHWGIKKQGGGLHAVWAALLSTDLEGPPRPWVMCLLFDSPASSAQLPAATCSYIQDNRTESCSKSTSI